MKTIGLTGNIAVGKSTVASMLRDLGAQVLDADQVVHALMAPGESANEAIVAEFGPAMRRNDGTIDRAALGRIVFADPAALERLESILDPLVYQRAVDWLAEQRESGADVAVVDAVKLIEAGFDTFCDQVWVVTATPEQQLIRLIKNRGMSEADAHARLTAQPPLEKKLARADVVIDNSGTLEDTRRQVESAWQRLLSRS